MPELKHFIQRQDTFESAALRDNPAGDPSRRAVALLLPRRMDSDPDRRYPVVFFLAGFAGSGQSLLNWKGWTPTLPERLDALHDSGRIGDMIAVFPDVFTKYGGSQYLNSDATGRYEDMICRDLVEWVNRSAPALDDGRHRAVVGKSSGGYGALVLGMRHPETFSAVACHSGDMYFEYCYAHDFPRLLKQLRKYGGLERFLKAFFDAPKKTSDLVLSMNIVAMAAAYSPSSQKPGAVDLPFDVETGEILEKVWARWLKHDPVRLCERYAPQLKALRLLYLDCGSRDQFHLQYGLRILSKRLELLGVPHQREEFDDDHSDTAYRYEVSLPRVWDSIRPDSRAV